MGGALGCDRHIPESCLLHHSCSSLGGRNEAERAISRPAAQEHYCDQPVLCRVRGAHGIQQLPHLYDTHT